MEESHWTPDPDALLRRAASDNRTAAVEEAIDEAASRLPCDECGSNDRPIIDKPERLSLDWWDDPSSYIACAGCGAYLGYLPPNLEMLRNQL